MPRYLVTTRRAARGTAVSALDAAKAEPGVTLLSTENPESVTVEATEAVAGRLRAKLDATHFVELEIRRSLH